MARKTRLSGTNDDDILSAIGESALLVGGRGNDTYLVDDQEDTISEKSNGGTDRVISSTDWILGEFLEILELTGSEDLSGTGNDEDNILLGNQGNNSLYGLGGDDMLFGDAGDDLLAGGGGSDEIDGGEGVDTAVFEGSFADYTFLWDGTDLLATNTLGETDILRNVEFLSFDDQVVDVADISTESTDSPVAMSDAALGNEDEEITIRVLDNDIGKDITLVSATSGARGLVMINGDGTITYRPNQNINGSDQFSYTIADPNGRTSTATVAVNIAAINDAPEARNDTFATLVDSELSPGVSILGNDSDPDGDILTVQPATVLTALGGTANVGADGMFTYTPPSGASGTDSFEYMVDDGQGGQATAIVFIEILPPENASPIATNDSFSTTADTPFTSNTSVLANDSDPDSDPLRISGYDQTSANGGSVTMNDDGTFTYVPAAGFSGNDDFSYSVSDGKGGTATAIVSIDVLSDAAAPYYVEALTSDTDSTRLNYPGEIGSAVTVTYTFLDSVPAYYGSADSTFQAFSEQQRSVTRDILKTLESFTNISFVEVSSAADATITFGTAEFSGDSDGTAWQPFGNSVGDRYSDVWIDSAISGDIFTVGSYAYSILLHELGHAIGLDHPIGLDGMEDNRQYSIMSGLEHQTHFGDVDGFQIFDIAALQYLYGTNENFALEDNVYYFDDLDNRIVTIWDSGGIDTFNMSGATHSVTLDLFGGTFSTVSSSGTNNIALAFGVEIENAIGSDFDDRIIGNDLANAIFGGLGDDILTGRDGDDVFLFGEIWGHDVITDFQAGSDRLDFSKTGASYSDLDISQTDEGILISFNANSLHLIGVTAVESADFLF